MSEDSQLKRKARRILLGLGITSIVGGGLFFKHKHDQSQLNEEMNKKANTEWKQQHLDADSIVADAQTAHFYASKKADQKAIDSLGKQSELIANKIEELYQAAKNEETKLNAELYATAQAKDAKKYLALYNTMLKDEVYIDYDKEDESGISLKDMLEANADLGDARWVSINRRKKENYEYQLRGDYRSAITAGKLGVSIIEKDDNGDFKIVGKSVIDSKKQGWYPVARYDENSQEKVVLKDLLEEAPASTVKEIKKQMTVLCGFGLYLGNEVRAKKGYTVEKNGEEVKEALLQKALEREGKS